MLYAFTHTLHSYPTGAGTLKDMDKIDCNLITV